MSYLKHPAKTPDYRQARSHLEFICRIRDYMPRSIFIDRTIKAQSALSSTDPKFKPSTRAILSNCSNSQAAISHLRPRGAFAREISSSSSISSRQAFTAAHNAQELEVASASSPP